MIELDAEMLERLWNAGLFNNPMSGQTNMPEVQFREVLRILRLDDSPFTGGGPRLSGRFDRDDWELLLDLCAGRSNSAVAFRQEPNAGLSMCRECGAVYLVTPSADAYLTNDEDDQFGKLCWRCLMLRASTISDTSEESS
jgi:hypothetical protein